MPAIRQDLVQDTAIDVVLHNNLPVPTPCHSVRTNETSMLSDASLHHPPVSHVARLICPKKALTSTPPQHEVDSGQHPIQDIIDEADLRLSLVESRVGFEIAFEGELGL